MKIPFFAEMSKLLRLLLVAPVLVFLLQGCVQWRYTDRELVRIFRVRKLPLAIHHIRAKGANIRYVEVRRHDDTTLSSKPNVLLVHGAPSSLRVWTGYLTDPNLAKVCNIYAVDRPGYGHSDFGKADTSILHQVMVLEEILKRHPGPWVVFGSSFGGPIAAVLAARNPDLVSSLLLTSPALAPGKEKIYRISYTIKLPAFGWMFPKIFRVANAEKLSHESQLRSIEHYYGKIVQPVTYIYGGKDDLIYTVNASYAKEMFNQAHLKQICLVERPHFFTFTEQGLITRELVGLLDYARPPKNRLEEARREEAADSSNTGRRLPFRPMPKRKVRQELKNGQ